MDGGISVTSKKTLHSLSLKNFLSYGSEGEELRLEPLNVLIGPNSSGKSNIIEALSLLRAAPSDFAGNIREGGGISDWLWKGSQTTPVAGIEAVVDYPEGTQPLRYKLNFTMVGQRLEITDEAIENIRPLSDQQDVYFYYRYQNGRPALNVRTKIDAPAGQLTDRVLRKLQREQLIPDQSVLSQRKDPDQYPELTYLGQQFGNFRLYREWNLGRYTPPRLPQKADLPEDFLSESADNLGLVLNNLEHYNDTKRYLLDRLRHFYDGVTDLTTRIQGGTVQIFIHERGLRQPIPATRLSDGMLRYLCLLAVLLHPSPPPLVCIEEPELGMHPDMLSTIAELLIEASERMQLIVTTHSDTLVSALHSTPESVIVCERDDQGTHLERLDPDQLEVWLEKYSLGQLWRMGEIGGTRW
ncbi:MAG: AAA family ATPase [Roseiflexaceae bacterium]